MKKVILFLVIMLLSMSSFASESYSEEQHQLLQLAHKSGEPFNMGMAMMGILLRESRVGKFGPVGDLHMGVGKRSYGVMQVTLAAAEDVVYKHCPHLNRNYDFEEELISDLMYDDVWNIKIAACYLKHMRENTSRWSDAIAAYNMGLGNLRRYGRGVVSQNEEYVEFVQHHVNHGLIKDYYVNHIQKDEHD